jgi:hypothetical protein
MAVNTYDPGDQVRLAAAIVTSAGAAVDPTALTLIIKPATGTATTYTYAGAQITKDSTGNYHMDYTVPTGSGGVVYYKYTATGAAIGMEQGSFMVRADSTS